MDGFRKEQYPSFQDQFGDIKKFTDNEMKRQIPSVKSLMLEFTQETSVHGVKYISGENSLIRRVLWLLCLLGMISVLTIMVRPRFIQFLANPVQTKVTLQSSDTLEFPSVSICNFNRFRNSTLPSQEAKDILQEIFSPFAQSKLNWSDPVYQTNLGWTSEDWYQWYENSSHQIQTMLFMCYWKSQLVNCADYFTRSVTEMGFCYTFNSKEFKNNNKGSLKVKKPGGDNGLFLRMNVEQDEYTYSTSNAAGFKVLLHGVEDEPLINELGFAVSPGTDTYVGVRKTELDRLPPPYEGSTCVDTTKPSFVNPLKYFKKYNLQACRVECRLNFTYEKCNCKMYYQPGNNLTLCSPYQLKFCWQPAVAELASSDNDCGCFEECKMTVYDARVSWAYFPASHILADLEKRFMFTEDYTRKNFLELRIYYEELNYDSIVQLPAYEFGNLFSDVGGQMGLCLGASILSVYEILEAVAMAIITFCKKRKNYHKTKPTSNVIQVKPADNKY